MLYSGSGIKRASTAVVTWPVIIHLFNTHLVAQLDFYEIISVPFLAFLLGMANRVAPVSASRSVPFMADPVDEAVDSDSPDRESAARGRFKISSSVFSVCSSDLEGKKEEVQVLSFLHEKLHSRRLFTPRRSERNKM